MLQETNLRPQATEWTGEPSLYELLSDPIAQALMVADGVKCHDLDALFANAEWRCVRQRTLSDRTNCMT